MTEERLLPGVFSTAISLLERLKKGGCWCQMSIGNPVIRNHSETCEQVRRFMLRYEKGELSV